MGLLLICPHCQAKMPLAFRTCPACSADLRDLPPKDRRYFLAGPETNAAPPPSREMVAAPQTMETAWAEAYPETLMPETPLTDSQDVSLCEALDRILNKGAVLFGEVMISVADIDLIYLGLQVILSSMETAGRVMPAPGTGLSEPNLFDGGVCS
jgi:gas vesicle structural protein